MAAQIGLRASAAERAGSFRTIHSDATGRTRSSTEQEQDQEPLPRRTAKENQCTSLAVPSRAFAAFAVNAVARALNRRGAEDAEELPDAADPFKARALAKAFWLCS